MDDNLENESDVSNYLFLCKIENNVESAISYSLTGKKA